MIYQLLISLVKLVQTEHSFTRNKFLYCSTSHRNCSCLLPTTLTLQLNFPYIGMILLLSDTSNTTLDAYMLYVVDVVVAQMQCFMGMPSLANATYRAFRATVCKLASLSALTTKILTRSMQPGMAATTTTLSNTSLILHQSAAHFLSSAAESRTLTSMNKPISLYVWYWNEPTAQLSVLLCWL